jgi:hypothetical protein
VKCKTNSNRLVDKLKEEKRNSKLPERRASEYNAPVTFKKGKSD